jgi:outer membrane protein assembly factor BamB
MKPAAADVVLALVLLIPAAVAAQANDWPSWRGPEGNSLCRQRDLPLIWRHDVAVLWKVALPGWGNSTPITWGEGIFVTSQADDGRLFLLRLEKRSGQLIWSQEVGSGEVLREANRGEQKFHRLHNLASPSPVTDGQVVVAHFGNGDLATFDLAGKLLWKRNLQRDHGKYTIWWGHANSPVLFENLVISVCMQDSLADLEETPALSYLVAHHKLTGDVVWTRHRTTKAAAEECDAYTTPVLRLGPQRTELIVMGANQLDAYDPASGRQIWYLDGLRGGRTITGPTLAGDMLYATQGMRGPLLAVKLPPRHEGALDRRAIVWKYTSGTPDSCCPVVWADLVFIVTDDGIARCLDANTGHLKWQERLKGRYKASPLAAEGRIYFLNEMGLCTVVSASPRFSKLAENQLDDETLASPAAFDGKLLIRGRNALYCLGR